jgi:hypothetical protein
MQQAASHILDIGGALLEDAAAHLAETIGPPQDCLTHRRNGGLAVVDGCAHFVQEITILQQQGVCSEDHCLIFAQGFAHLVCEILELRQRGVLRVMEALTLAVYIVVTFRFIGLAVLQWILTIGEDDRHTDRNAV